MTTMLGFLALTAAVALGSPVFAMKPISVPNSDRRFGEVANVRHFGAKGDGFTWEDAAFTAAASVLPSRSVAC
jgi:polygalacturonase